MSISWEQYSIVMAGIVGAYYFLVIRTCKKSIPTRLPLGDTVNYSSKNYNRPMNSADTISDGSLSATANSLDSSMIHELLDELNAYFRAVTGDNPKDVVSNDIQAILFKYKSLKESPHRSNINLLIIESCEAYCSTELSEDEVDALWR